MIDILIILLVIVYILYALADDSEKEYKLHRVGKNITIGIVVLISPIVLVMLVGLLSMLFTVS